MRRNTALRGFSRESVRHAEVVVAPVILIAPEPKRSPLLVRVLVVSSVLWLVPDWLVAHLIRIKEVVEALGWLGFL